MMPYQAWHGSKPDLGMLYTFGCTAYIHIQKKERNGLQPKSQKCIYLGFEHGYKGWHCLDPLIRHTIISYDVIFDESDFPGLSVMENKNEPNIPLPTLFPIEPGVVPNMQPPLDPAPPEANPDIDDPTDHPNQVPPPIPAAPPHCSDHAMICQDYRQLHDPFLCLR